MIIQADTNVRIAQSGEAQLRQHVKDLEARPSGVRDGGTWKSGTEYQAGDLVSHGGSGWICKETHTSVREFDHQRFRLFVKKGQDGKDAR